MERNKGHIAATSNAIVGGDKFVDNSLRLGRTHIGTNNYFGYGGGAAFFYVEEDDALRKGIKFLIPSRRSNHAMLSHTNEVRR